MDNENIVPIAQAHRLLHRPSMDARQPPQGLCEVAIRPRIILRQLVSPSFQSELPAR